MPAVARAEISSALPGRIDVESDYRLKDQVKGVPGALWDNPRKTWHVPQTWGSCLALRAQLGAALEIGPGLNSWAFEERDRKNLVLEYNKLIVDGVEEVRGLVSDGFAEFDGLYPSQQAGVAAIRLARQFGLFDDMGAGKGRTAMAGLRALQLDGEDIFPALIVAPKSMLHTWERKEIPLIFPDATISVAAGTPTVVKKAMEPGSDFYVMTYDTARRYSRLASFPTVALAAGENEDKELNAIGFKTVIADEAQRMINPGSKQTRALWYLGDKAEFRLALTGTPIQDTPEDLWSILRFISKPEFPTKTSFVERFLKVDYNEWGGRVITGLNPVNEPEYRVVAESRCRRVPKAVALPFLPPKVFQVRWVEMTPKQRKSYQTMKEHLVADFESGARLIAKNNLEAATRLMQIANASGEIDYETVIDEETSEEVQVPSYSMALPSPKIDAFLDDWDNGDYGDESVVVFSDSRQLAELLHQELDRKKIAHGMITGGVTGEDRETAKDAFQAGETKLIIITRAGGEGITLTAASTMVRLYRAWSYIIHNQSEDRVHRIGSEIHESITYVDYIVESSVEEGQVARLNGKRERATEVLRDDELKALLDGRYDDLKSD